MAAILFVAGIIRKDTMIISAASVMCVTTLMFAMAVRDDHKNNLEKYK